VSEIKFLAALPDLQSALTMSGGRGSGARVRLELPESEAEAVLLIAHHCRGRLLEVTFKVVDDTETDSQPKTTPARRNLRRSQD